MKRIQSFEQFSTEFNRTDEGFAKFLHGGKNLTLDGKALPALKAKYCNINKDGAVVTKATKTPLFTIEEGKPMTGTKVANTFLSSLKKEFSLDDAQALEATLAIYDWNGFIVVDPAKSKFDSASKKLEIVKAESSKSGIV